MKPSPEQLRVLHMMSTHGRLIRLPGGFWTVRGIGQSASGAPEWWTTVQTVRAMERRGWIARTNVHPEEWRDDRELTEKGRGVVEPTTVAEQPYKTTTSSGNSMVRLVVRMPNGRRRTVWAVKLRPSKYGRLQWLVLTNEGEESREGREGDVREIIVGDPADVISEVPARLNLHYGKMEVCSPHTVEEPSRGSLWTVDYRLVRPDPIQGGYWARDMVAVVRAMSSSEAVEKVRALERVKSPAYRVSDVTIEPDHNVPGYPSSKIVP